MGNYICEHSGVEFETDYFSAMLKALSGYLNETDDIEIGEKFLFTLTVIKQNADTYHFVDPVLIELEKMDGESCGDI